MNYCTDILKKLSSSIKYIEFFTSEDINIGISIITVLVLNLDPNLNIKPLNDKTVKDYLEILNKLCQGSREFATKLRFKISNFKKNHVDPEQIDK